MQHVNAPKSRGACQVSNIPLLLDSPTQPKIRRATCDPESPCAGHYIDIYEATGCPPGCPSNNFRENVIMAEYVDGEMDTYCGPTCCWSAQFCPNDGGDGL